MEIQRAQTLERVAQKDPAFPIVINCVDGEDLAVIAGVSRRLYVATNILQALIQRMPDDIEGGKTAWENHKMNIARNAFGFADALLKVEGENHAQTNSAPPETM